MMNRRELLATGLSAAAMLAAPAARAEGSEFDLFIQQLRPRALSAGISADVFDQQTAALRLDQGVIAQTEKQSEFSRPFWDYVEGAVSAARIRLGRNALKRSASAFDWIEENLGVDAPVVAGIWGMESNFGTAMGKKDVLRSVASLAFSGYRDGFYENEFIAALTILQQGHTDRAGLVGSWSGAMGQTQFIPSSFLAYAFDADGDGRKNIWTSDKDALASAANHLRIDGWKKGLPWGFEVIVDKDFDFTYGDRMARHSFRDLAMAGLQRPGKLMMPTLGSGGLYLPAGIDGPAFIITDNFEVIRKYNTSDAYAIGVGLLGDRLYGGPALAGRWPKDAPQLGNSEIAELQRRLKALGLPISKIDGRLGWQTRQGVQAVQGGFGLVPDGHPTPALLTRLRAK